MPHHWGNIFVVTKDELVPKYYNTFETLKSTIRRYADKPYGIKKVQKGGNGRMLLIDFDSLPMDMQNSIGDSRKMHHPLIKHYETSAAAVRFYSNFEFEDGTPLKIEAQEKYITNASVLIAISNLRDERLNDWAMKGKTGGKLMQTLWQDAITFNEFLPKLHAVTHSLPKGETHFGRVFKEFLNNDSTEFNFKSLISGKERNANAKKMTDEMLQLLNDMFAGQDHKPTRSDVSDQYQAFLEGNLDIISHRTGEIYNPKEKYYKSLSDASVIGWLGRWENAIGTEAKRSGDRQKTIQKYIPSHMFTKLKESGLLLSIDDRQPPFFYNEKRERVWFYMALDVASEAWTCWVWGKSKTGLIMDFYRQLVRNYEEWGINLPLELECESSLNSSFKNTFLKNGAMFDEVTIYTHYARGKAIERKIGELRYRHEKDKVGWLARPHARKEDNQKSEDDFTVVPFENIVRQSLMDVQTWNNMAHGEKKDKSRWEFFLENQTQKTQPTNWKAFLPYIGFPEDTSCNAGIINFRSKKYVLALNSKIALGEDLLRLLTHVEGKQFTIYWLDGNDCETLKALIYHQGMLICEAIPQPGYSKSKYERADDPIHDINRQLMSAYSTTVSAFMAERKREIDRVTIVDRRKKTLNNFFTIPGLEDYIPSDEPATEVPTENNEDYDYTPEVSGTARSWQQNYR